MIYFVHTVVLLLLTKIPNSNTFVVKFQANTLNINDVNANGDKKQSLAIKNAEKIEIESLVPEAESNKSNEWAEIELGNLDDKQNTFYQVNNENSGESMENEDVEAVTHDLTDDIAINQMLADQGAPYNPDAEVFDINQFDLGKDASKVASHESKLSAEQESFDYQPYHHQNFDKQTSTIK